MIDLLFNLNGHTHVFLFWSAFALVGGVKIRIILDCFCFTWPKMVMQLRHDYRIWNAWAM